MLISKIKLNPLNFNIMTQEESNLLKDDIQHRIKDNDEWFVENLKVKPLETGNYLLINGEHRLLACKELGIDEIPDKYITIKDRTEEQIKEDTWAHNIRGSHHPIKLALFLYEEKKKGLRQSQIARKYKISKSRVSEILSRLEKLHPTIIEDALKVRHAELSGRMFEELMKFKDYPQTQIALYKLMKEGKMYFKEVKKALQSEDIGSEKKILIQQLIDDGASWRELSKIIEIPVEILRRWYKVITGPQPMTRREMKKEKQSDKDERATKIREFKAQTTLDKARERCREMEERKKLLIAINKLSRLKRDIYIKKLGKYFESLPLEKQDDFVKFLQVASIDHIWEIVSQIENRSEPNFRFRRDVDSDKEYSMYTVKISKKLTERIKKCSGLELAEFIKFKLIEAVEKNMNNTS